MTTRDWGVRRVETLDDRALGGLVGVLIDCVEGGASVSFMHPLSRERAALMWRRVAEGVGDRSRALIVAEDASGVCGTVQLLLEQPENQPHRAEVAKMLVHRRSRRLGWTAAGDIPGYALLPQGGLCGTTVFYRDLTVR